MQYYLMFWPRNFCDDQVMLLKASESDNYNNYIQAAAVHTGGDLTTQVTSSITRLRSCFTSWMAVCRSLSTTFDMLSAMCSCCPARSCNSFIIANKPFMHVNLTYHNDQLPLIITHTHTQHHTRDNEHFIHKATDSHCH